MPDDRPHRLTRLNDIRSDAPVYFVTTCTHQRKSLLADADVHISFRTFCKSAPDHGAFIGTYVLMPDHLHLFVSIEDEKTSLSEWMRSLKGVLSKTLRNQSIPSPHWQKGFFDHILRSDESYVQKSDYIGNNPVRAGLAKSPSDWPFAGDFAQL